MAKKLEALLGNHVIKYENDTEVKVPVSSFCGKDTIIGIYFSAHWCSPCRTYTPMLIEFYKTFKQKNDQIKFEIVFVSWDKDIDAFKEYFSSMPWLALPYQPERKGKLSKKFRVQGIPKLVVLDGEIGKTITSEGYSCLMEDRNGAEFPWRPKKFNEVIQGKLIRNGSEEVDAIEALKGKIVGLYFSAHWCPPCRAFTPELVNVFKILQSDKKNFEIVFVSSDRCKQSFDKYYKTMPWLAVPFEDTRANKLTTLYAIDGIPALIILDESGEIITMNGRGAVSFDKNAVEFPWYPKTLNELTGSAAVQLNESACLVLFTEGEDEDIEMAKQVLLDSSSEEHSKGDDQELFFFYGADDEICDSVRNFAHLDDHWPLLVILDFPDRKVYQYPIDKNITEESVKNFVQQYFDETLEFQMLK